MILKLEPDIATQWITSEDEVSMSAELQKTLQTWIYSNRMRVAPRKLKELVQEEIVSLREFLVTGDEEVVRERGRHLAHEGLGQQSMINLTSTLRLSCWELAKQRPDSGELVTTLEVYTVALLDGFLKTYEADLCLEQQRTSAAFVRSLERA